MLDKFHIRHDWVAILALLFGAAVILPSLVSLLLSLGAVAVSLF